MKKRNSYQKEIIELWHSLDDKPGIADFRALCLEKGFAVSYGVLRQWRHKGYLPGDLVGKPRKMGANSQFAGILRRAQGDVREAARESSAFSKTMIREVVAKTMRCADAFVTRVTEEAVKVKIDGPSDLAIVAGVAMQVMGKAAEVSESLQLLIVTEKNIEAEEKDAGPINLDERRKKLAKNLGVG